MNMEITNISLNSILDMLRVLDSDNKRWLADHLYEDIRAEKKGSLEYPVIPKNRKPSRKVLENAAGPLPQGFDIDKETELMWEEMAK